MMIGGENDVVKRLDPLFRTLAPGPGDIPRRTGRDKLQGTAELGYLHCGPNGVGHFVKMVHNGIEYGLMAAYAEGMGILRDANIGKADHEVDAETTPLRHPEHYRYDFNLADIAEVWRRGGVLAPRFDGRGSGRGFQSQRFYGTGFGLRGRTMDHQRGDRRSRSGARPDHGALCALLLARPIGLPGQTALGDALPVRRTPRKTNEVRRRSEAVGRRGVHAH
jgi:hypothetical protein